MQRLRLTLSCNDYDRTRFLIDGTVVPGGIDLTAVALSSRERHERFTRDLEFDVCELQMGVFLGWKARGAPFSAIPVFPHRKFCHANVLINSASNIERPEDLRGKTIGMQAHFNPVSIWMRGVLEEEHGVPARSLKIRTNVREQVPEWEPPSWMDIQKIPKGQRADALLARGEVDAVMLPEVAPHLIFDTPGVRRLWPNFREVEKDYYTRTGIFPIRHVIVVKNQVLERHPWVAKSLVDAFAKAKEIGIKHVSDPRRSFLAWYGAELEEEMAFFKKDAWLYNIKDNRAALETMARYAELTGVTERALTIDEMFAQVD